MNTAQQHSSGEGTAGVSTPREGAWRQIIEAAGLPAELAELTRRVVRRTRLWRAERADIARELVSHFRDGLDAGRTPAELAQAFGDPVATARLMRSAKRRQRPWTWRALNATGRAAGWCAAGLAVVYAGLALRYYTATPTVKLNPIQELNAAALAVPEEQRAWPLYRKALIAMGPLPAERPLAADAQPKLTELRPWMPGWERARDYLASIQGPLAMVRDAAARPALGITVGNRLEDAELERALTPPGATPGTDVPQPAEPWWTLNRPGNPAAIGMLLPHLSRLRHIARLLESDAWAAAEAGDTARVAADVRAIGGVARHAWDPPVLISQLVSVAVHVRQTQLVRELLARQPASLASADLVDLAHRVATYRGGGPLRPDFDTERRLFFEDMLQRTYSDDGAGDGRLTYAGTLALEDVQRGSTYPAGPDLRAELNPLGPLISAASASRRRLSEAYASGIADVQRWADTPTWARGEPPDIERALGGPIARGRYTLMLILIPALQSAIQSFDRATTERDATLVAIALELHRRQTGSFPASLAELPARLLPSVPFDPFDGKPLKYRLSEGRLVLYSIGVDRVDDGGVPPEASPSLASAWRTVDGVKQDLAEPTTAPRLKGDWVLWQVPH